MALRNARTNDSSQGPGLTPIDNAAPSRSMEKHEPDRTTGRLPSQDGDTRKSKKKKRARRSS